MKNKLFLLLALISTSLFSQNIQLDWVNNINGNGGIASAKCIAINNNDDIYTAGDIGDAVCFDANTSQCISTQSHVFYIYKSDMDGNYIWVNVYDISNESTATDIVVRYENNQEFIYILGFFSGELDIDKNPNTPNFITGPDSDIFLLKLDSSGHFIWAKQFGNNSLDTSFELAFDANNNVYLTGFFNATMSDFILAKTYEKTTGNATDMKIYKISPNGNIVWEKTITGNGSGYVGANTIEVDNNNDILVSGNFVNTVDFDPGNDYHYMTSYDHYDDIFILKLNNNGEFIWVKKISGNLYDGAIRLKADSFNNIYLIGYFIENIDFDPSANQYLSYSARPGSSGLDSDKFLLKLSSNGQFIWVDQFVKINLYNLDLHDNKVQISALLDQSYDIITSNGTLNLSQCNNYSKGCVFEISNNGSLNNYNYFCSNTSFSILYPYCIKTTNDYVIMSGLFSGNIDMDPTNNAYIIDNSNNGVYGTESIFVSKYNFITSKIKSNNLEFISIYPNPSANGVFYVSNEQLATLDITVFDTTGKIVLKQVSNNPSTQINLSKQTKGIYFVKIDNKNMVVTKKVVVE